MHCATKHKVRGLHANTVVVGTTQNIFPTVVTVMGTNVAVIPR